MRGMLGDNEALRSFVGGPLSDYLVKLNSDPEKWGPAFNKFLREENPWPAHPVWKIWKTLTLDHPQTAKAYRAALSARGHSVGGWADELLGKMEIAETETEAKLVRLTVAELGFKNPATYDEIIAKAKELGLELCPAEVGPKLRLEYESQPNGEWLTVAMKPIVGSDGFAHVFYVSRSSSGERWLIAYYVYSDDRWNLDYRFVFLSSK